MPSYVALPAYRAPSAINFDPLNEGLDDLSKQFEKNRLLRQAQQIGATLAVQPTNQAQVDQNPLLAQPSLSSPAGTDYSKAISSVESGGRYDALGPVTRTGDRAYGKYQVMGANVPAWTQEVLGRKMTPQEFLANTDAQEKVFAAKFGQYVDKTGSPQDAASMWFTGRPQAQGANAKDLYGTTGNEYVRRFNSALGGAPTTAPAQAAPAPSGPNYRAAAAKAFEYGNIPLGTQFLQQQQELDNTAYARSHQAQQEATAQQQWQAGHGLQVAQNTRAEASAGREAEQFADARHKAATARIGSLASAIAAEPDPARQASMWKSLVAVDPEVAQGLQQNGIDPNDVASGTRFMINLARGPVTPKLTEVSPGGTLYDENSRKPVFTAPEKTPAASIPSGYRVGLDGRSLEFIPGGPADPSKAISDAKFSEGAARAANFANMMNSAEKTLEAMSPKGPDGSPEATKNPIGFLGTLREGYTPEGAANVMRSPEYRKYRQGAMQWVRAKLRKESGAQISPSEFEGDFQTFFPQYGDDDGVIKQKQIAREQAQKGLIAESRGAYEQLFPASASVAPVTSATKPQASRPAQMPEGARKAPDGNWYVEQNGQFFRVDP